MEAAIPIERTERIPVARRDGPGARGAGDLDHRRAAVRSRGHGRLRGHRRRHVRRRPVRREGAALRSRRSTPARCTTRSLSRGECIEIATGAPLPAGADAVVMVEETEKTDGGGVRVFTPVYPGQHVGRRGRRHRGRTDGAARRRRAEPEPHRRARRHRRRRRRRVREAARRDPVDGQRNRRAWTARSGPDRSTTSTGSRCRQSFARTAASR